MFGWVAMLKNNWQYTADDGDNHQLPVQTYARQRCDCEDFSYVIETFWRLLKLAPDQVFNTTGSTSFGYHDWPIAFLSADDIKGTPVEKYGAGWYIYEGTLTYIPPCPMPLIGSSYHVVDGLANWAFKGKVKPEYGAQFQLSSGAVGAEAVQELQKKRDGEKKNREINQYWKDWHAKNGQ